MINWKELGILILFIFIVIAIVLWIIFWFTSCAFTPIVEAPVICIGGR